MRLCLGATIGRGFCERERLARECPLRGRAAGVMQREGEVGLYARSQPALLCGGRVEGCEQTRLRELPFAAAVVHIAQLVLDRCERRRLGLGGGALVARESAAVVAEQGAQVADALVQPAGVRVTQRERRFEMFERVGVRVQRRRILRGERGSAALRPRESPARRRCAATRAALSSPGRRLDSAAAARPWSRRRRARPVCS